MYETASVMFTSLGSNIAVRCLFDMEVKPRQLPCNSFIDIVAFKRQLAWLCRIVAFDSQHPVFVHFGIAVKDRLNGIDHCQV